MPHADRRRLGAGPSGLVTARYLKNEGFDVAIYEQSRSLGGQWSADPRSSGVWPSMRTNTTRVLTAFSDLPHPPGTQVYPTNQAMLAYLRRYAEAFALMPHLRVETRVEQVGAAGSGGGWVVRSSAEVARRSARPATTRRPARRTRGRQSPTARARHLSGKGGVTHTNAYKDPERYRGRRVLVADAPSARSRSPATWPCSAPSVW